MTREANRRQTPQQQGVKLGTVIYGEDWRVSGNKSQFRELNQRLLSVSDPGQAEAPTPWRSNEIYLDPKLIPATFVVLQDVL